MCVEAGLTLGQHRELVGRLFSLTTEYPLRETFYRQLMLALYRSERQADALAVYRSARRTLQEQLGLEPGRALRELQRAILADDDRLVVWNRRGPAEPSRRPETPYPFYGSTSLIA
jgi:DNA-binding SARP family transcriptional activator